MQNSVIPLQAPQVTINHFTQRGFEFVRSLNPFPRPSLENTTCNSPASTVKRTAVDTCVPCLWPSKQHNNKVVACPFGINAASLCSGKTNTEERVSRDGVTGWCSRAFLELFHKQVYLLDVWLHPCGIGTPAFKLLHPLGFECLVFV